MHAAWVLSIGTELTLGQSLDTNSAWLAQRLAELGIRADRHLTVADDLPAVCDALRQAAGAAGVVLVTGGLGPTEDDLTRDALAEAAGAPLVEHAPTVAHLNAFFAARGRPMPARNLVQAQVPRGAEVLPNPVGTAPGLCLRVGAASVYALPGVPFEMKHIFEHEVAPRLQATARGAVVRSRKLNCFGLGEADLGERIRDLMARGRNPEVGTTAQLGVIGVRINAAAADAATADRMLDEIEAELRSRLEHAIFGRDDETLAAVVLALLRARGQTLSLAESCTGGMLGAALTDVPGSSAALRGGLIAYSNDAKRDMLGVSADDLAQHGAVSEPVARAMAAGARRVFRSDFALSVTGVAGPGGGTSEKPVGLVYGALATPATIHARELRFGASPRDVIRTRTVHAALNLLRLELLGLLR